MKSKVKVLCYSEQDLTPKAQDVIRGIVNDGFPDHEILFGDYYKTADYPVLVFGNRGPADFDKRTKFVYTYSIAQLMTKPNARTVLCAAIQQIIGEPEPIPFEAPTYRLDSAYKSSLAAMGWDYSKPTVIDIETSGNLGETHTPEEVSLISIAFYQEGKAPLVYVSVNSYEGGSPALHPYFLEWLREELQKFKTTVWHNGKFDIRVLNRVLDIELYNSFDTMLAHHVLNQAAGMHDLKSLARLYFGAPDWEDGIKKYLTKGGHYENIPRDMLVQYNGWDVYWTYKLFQLFAPQIEADENATKAFMLEMSFAEFLLDVEKVGIPFDIDYASVLGSELQFTAEKHEQTLRAYAANDKFNPGSWQQVKRWLLEHGVDTPSTDEDHITEIMQGFDDKSIVHLFCKYLLEYRKAKKMRGTYVQGWWKQERKGRVHPTFLVHGTSTGRLSSTGPNAQNVPRDKKIRRLVALTGKNGVQNG